MRPPQYPLPVSSEKQRPHVRIHDESASNWTSSGNQPLYHFYHSTINPPKAEVQRNAPGQGVNQWTRYSFDLRNPLTI